MAELAQAFADTLSSEGQAQRVLERYWWLLLVGVSRYPHHMQGVYSQVPIGLGDKEYVPDFLVLDKPRSFTAPPVWRAIELEPPGGPVLVNRDGTMARRLRGSYEQVLAWDEWLSAHEHSRNELFWADSPISYEFHIYLGRRANADEKTRSKIRALNRANRNLNLEVHTYDNLLERAESMDEHTWDWYEDLGLPVLRPGDFRQKRSWGYDRHSDRMQPVSHREINWESPNPGHQADG